VEEVTKALDAESEESLKKPVSTFGPKATCRSVDRSVAHVANTRQLIARARQRHQTAVVGVMRRAENS